MTKGHIAKEVALWAFALFLSLVCLRSGLMKMPGVPGEEFWARDFARWGYSSWFKTVVGIAELSSFALVCRVQPVLTHATHHETSRLPLNFLLLFLSLIIVFTRKPTFLKRRGNPGAADSSSGVSRTCLSSHSTASCFPS